jgi:penicillin amidase
MLPTLRALRMKRLARILAWLTLTLLSLGLLLMLAAWLFVRASLPQLDGQQLLTGLQAPVKLGRDARGTVVIESETRLDAARALGFVHAQERFFEMDLARRSAAGELSALFGPGALEMDRSRRLHRLRHRLSERWLSLSAAEQQLLQAYCAGVNQGLQSLPVRPWAYGLLRATPQPWQPVDSLLVVAEMFHALQGHSIEGGLDRALLRQHVGDALFEWLNPRGGPWDAALDGSVLPLPAIPTPAVLDLRGRVPKPPGQQALQADPASPNLDPALPVGALIASGPGEDAPVVGSNNWAVAGTRSSHGGALLADDMHLGLGVPALWFRTQLQWGRAPQTWRVSGISLPGVPAVVVGSNGRVAWGFTNAYGQWFEWLEVPSRALQKPGDARLRTVVETLEVKGEPPQILEVREWAGAPIAHEEGGRTFALRWVAHEGAAYNLALDAFATARSTQEILDLARASGMPQLSVLAADAKGDIGWTLTGRLWQQEALSHSYGRLRAADSAWPSGLDEALAPRILNPQEGLLWTANNRLLTAGQPELLGDGGYDLGARAQQVRDGLRAAPMHSEASLSALQLERQARLMQAWGLRLQRWLEAQAAQAPGLSPSQSEALTLLKAWNGRADADQAAYRLIRRARQNILSSLWTAWTEPALGPVANRPVERYSRRSGFEFSASAALDAEPPHLLPPGHASWRAFGLAKLDDAVNTLTRKGQRPLKEAVWGEENTSRIRHVISRAVPALSRWLDMPSIPQGGDDLIPHVARPNFGQSQRLVVSPGREELGTLSMPGGQSGHPLSPFYGAGHQDWAQGHPTPLLAGSLQHQLVLKP